MWSAKSFYPILTKCWISRKSFVHIPNIKLYANPSCGSCADKWGNGYRDRRTDEQPGTVWVEQSAVWRCNVAGNINTYLGLHVKCSIFLSDINQIWTFSTNFHSHPQYIIYIRADRRTDRHGKGSGRISRLCRSA